MSSSGRVSISLEDVEKLTMNRAMTLMRQLQITVKDDNLSLSRAKLIITEYLKGGNSAGTRRPAPWADQDTTTAAINDDLSNRARIRDLYGQAEVYVKELPGPFRDDLSTVFGSYDRKLTDYKEDLKTSQCVLLFAGEMGSGKTSLINLLLGRDLLPTSDLRCTAAIVEISYGPKPLATIHWRDDSSGRALKPLKLACDSADSSDRFLQDLEQHIVKRDSESDESPYEKIELQWPLDMLKGGIVIVDSPGVGGSQTIPQLLSVYLEKAFGFIYVIDSSAAIHKHRLGQLLAKAVEANDGFEPSTTLFVCNRWDMVTDGASEEVKRSLRERLSMILPEIRQSQLYPISVLQSKEQVMYGQVSSNHKHLIDGIRRLLPQSMKGKLRFYYRYLSSLMKRSLYSLRMSHNMQKQRVEHIKKDYKNIESRMSRLQHDAQKHLEEMRKEVKRACMDAGFQAIQHLDSMKTRIRLLTWSQADCPLREKNWQNAQKNASMAIADKVGQELNRWERDVDLMNKMQNDVLKIFQKEFELLDNEIEAVEALLLDVTEVDDVKAMRNFTQSVKKNLDPKKQLRQQIKSRSDFMSLGAAVSSRFSLDLKDSNLKALFKDYNADPSKAMSKATEVYLSYFNDADVVSALTKYFDRFVKGIDRIGSFMPTMLAADQDLLKKLESDLQTGVQKLDAFPSMSKSCARIQGTLDMFYVQKLMATDFTADQLLYKESDRKGSGSFAVVYRADLRTRQGNLQVAIKEPLEPLRVEDVTDVLLEEQMLRDLSHENFVKYYGVCRKGPDNNIRLIMVMEYCPYTLKGQRIDKGDNAPSKLGNNRAAQTQAIEIITNYLVQICMGLKFLHSKAIVHRDLKPANVLLTADSKVRIADFGLAKKVKDIATQGIGTPVYMAPEILCHFMKYDTKADIYSLAMIMWELWYGEDMAQYAAEEIQGGLKNVIEQGWRPTLTKRDAPNEFWRELMVECWDANPTRRPTADQVARKLVRLYQEIRGKRSGQSTGSERSLSSTSSS